MLRFLLVLPTVIWLLFPPGICICQTFGAPEKGSQSQPLDGRGTGGHAPWCTANKGNVAYDEAPAQEPPPADALACVADLLDLVDQFKASPSAGSVFADFADSPIRVVSARLLACLWLE